MKGNYGALASVHLLLHADPARRWRRAVVLLLARGGPLQASAGGRVLDVRTWGGLVLFNQPVLQDQQFDYLFTLPSNSFGPAALMVVPLPL